MFPAASAQSMTSSRHSRRAAASEGATSLPVLEQRSSRFPPPSTCCVNCATSRPRRSRSLCNWPLPILRIPTVRSCPGLTCRLPMMTPGFPRTGPRLRGENLHHAFSHAAPMPKWSCAMAGSLRGFAATIPTSSSSFPLKSPNVHRLLRGSLTSSVGAVRSACSARDILACSSPPSTASRSRRTSWLAFSWTQDFTPDRWACICVDCRCLSLTTTPSPVRCSSA